MLKRSWRALLLVGAASLLLTGAAHAVDFTPGSAGLGDPFFPNAGNGGYDVKHYSLRLDYEPTGNRLDATAVIVAKATQNLSRFDLDLRGFEISRLLVNGRSAAHTRDGEQELVITPRTGLRKGKPFTVRIDYAGTPQVVTDPDESIEGWVPTADGAYVVGEPQGSSGWYPVNETPTDKATYDFRVTVPEGLTAMANGVLLARFTHQGKTTWIWLETDPMAPHLTTSTIGRFDLSISRVGRIPSYVAVDPVFTDRSALGALPAITQFYEDIYGPYPFNATGAVVDDAPDVGYALETQTKPVYDQMPGEGTLAHEQSHMWFGDSVTLTQWPDIWLHEGFATWSEWIWSEHSGDETAQQIFDQVYAVPATNVRFWTPPPAAPGAPASLFDGTIYNRGAMTLQALRQKIGDFSFFRLMRTWARQNRDGNVSTPEFIRLAEQISQQQLDVFFDVWLYRPEKPVSW